MRWEYNDHVEVFYNDKLYLLSIPVYEHHWTLMYLLYWNLRPTLICGDLIFVFLLSIYYNSQTYSDLKNSKTDNFDFDFCSIATVIHNIPISLLSFMELC